MVRGYKSLHVSDTTEKLIQNGFNALAVRDYRVNDDF